MEELRHYLVKAIQEQQEQIEALQSEIHTAIKKYRRINMIVWNCKTIDYIHMNIMDINKLSIMCIGE